MGEEGDCEELSLELSIGGKYSGKSGDKNANCDLNSESASRRKRQERVIRKSRAVDDKMFVEAGDMYNGGADEVRKEWRKMPCVSATGDGPKGRRVMGLLYKYDKEEVSIMCVCHGTSFSPPEFVEHAGGVDVSHPLRHITLLTSSSSGLLL